MVKSVQLGSGPLSKSITGRGQMAGFFTRALNLPPAGDQGFNDISGSVFVNAINSIAAEGITRGCNPPANDN